MSAMQKRRVSYCIEFDHVLHACAELLLEKEKIAREEFEALFGDEALR